MTSNELVFRTLYDLSDIKARRRCVIAVLQDNFQNFQSHSMQVDQGWLKSLNESDVKIWPTSKLYIFFFKSTQVYVLIVC